MIRGFVRSKGREELYGDLIGLTDDPLGAARSVEEHPPRPAPEKTPLYGLAGLR